MSAADELAAVAAVVPAAVRRVCERLEAAGHQAVTVGGAVRDALLGRAAGDWDVATSATPDQVIALFPRTVPTGLAHGTVTVLTGAGEIDHVEVTTFRGEGAYSDGRRPDSVSFGVPLEEDLARRDLVVNAIAYAPTRHQLIDPFGGREDLRAGRLRAVGEPLARFLEDGLRVMRAIRFAATLEFSLEAATEAALRPALPALAKVSKERITIELCKLLAAPRPSLGLAIAFRTGVMELVLPEVVAGQARWGRTDEEVGRRVDAAAPAARLGALVFDLAPAHPGPARLDKQAQAQVEAMLRALKMKVADLELASRVVAVAAAVAAPPVSLPQMRRLLAAVGRKAAEAVVSAWGADHAARQQGRGGELAALGAQVLAAGDPLAISELAISGSDLMEELKLAAGAGLGQALRALFEQVQDGAVANERGALLSAARQTAGSA